MVTAPVLDAACSALATARDERTVVRVAAQLRAEGMPPRSLWPLIARHTRVMGPRLLPGILARRDARWALAENQAMDAAARETCLDALVTAFERAAQYGRSRRSPLRRAIDALGVTLTAGWLDPAGRACARLFETACAPTLADEPGVRYVDWQPADGEEALRDRYDAHAMPARSLLLDAPTLSPAHLLRLVPDLAAQEAPRLVRHPQATPTVWRALLQEHRRLERQLNARGRAIWGTDVLHALASHPEAARIARVRAFLLRRTRLLDPAAEAMLLGTLLTPETVNGILASVLARPSATPAYAVTHLLALASAETLRAVDRRVLAPWFAADVDEHARQFMREILPALGPRGVTLPVPPEPTWGDQLPW